MSHTDSHPDFLNPPLASAQNPAAQNSRPVPPPPPTKAPSPTTSPPPTPPPPPPRATLPPIRPAVHKGAQSFPAPATNGVGVVSGIGSAKSVRWRDELPDFEKKNSNVATDSTSDPKKEPESESPSAEERIVRGAPPWLISTVIHLLILLILALITSPAGEALGTLMLEIGQSATKEDIQFTELVVDPAETFVEASDIVAEQEVMVDIPSIFEDSSDSEMSELSSVDLSLGPSSELPRPMFNGRSGAMKATLLALYGGTAETQEAVKLGLAWLARNQKKDGGWSKTGPYSDHGTVENRAAATAMALLALVGDGNTHKSGPYAKEVDKGVQFLVKQQSRSGFMAKEARGHEQAYAQAQATIVLCELYAMTKDSWLREKAQLAIDYAEDAQGTQGGWRYYPKSDSDTSITGWFVMALESGSSAGLDVDRNVLYRVEDYLDLAQLDEGASYAYQPRGQASAAMTAEGLLCRQYLGWPRNHPMMVQGVNDLLELAPFDYNVRDAYYWYYATQTLHHYGGEPWKAWNDKMRYELPKAQEKSGREAGSWDPQGDHWGDHGRLYTTCFSLFCLEVYYRHMPLYAAHAAEE